MMSELRFLTCSLPSKLLAKRHYLYDAAGRLTTQIEMNSSAAPVVTIIDTYDPVGNRIGHNVNGAATSWSYDAGDRLTTQVKTGFNATFVYDPAGNTLLKWQQGTNPMTFAYDAANRITTMLQGSALTTYSYDATGNLIGEVGNGSITTNVYDNENRLVEVQQTTSPTLMLTNSGFETPSLGSGTYAYAYNPTGAGVGWTFDSGSGVSGNDSGFTNANPDAPEGTQVGFLQDTGTFSQSITVVASAGTLTVSFQACQRDYDGVNGQEFTVSIGGTVVGTFTPTSIDYASFTTDPLFLLAGTYDLTFTGLNPLGGDNTAFIDAVTLSFTPASFDAVGDFTVTTPGVSDNGAWQYGWLPDLSDPASSFTMDNIVSLTWAGIDGFSGHYSDTGNAIVLGNLTDPPATIVQGTVSVPVGILVSGPSGTDGAQFGTLRFIAPASGVYNVSGTFEGLDVDETTTDVHVLQTSAGGDGTTTSLFSGYVDGYYGGGGSSTGPSPIVTFAFDAVALEEGDSRFFPIGDGGDGYYNDTTGLEVQVTLNVAVGTQVSTYTYDGDGMRRSAQEPSATVPTTFIWDGTDYLGEY